MNGLIETKDCESGIWDTDLEVSKKEAEITLFGSAAYSWGNTIFLHKFWVVFTEKKSESPIVNLGDYFSCKFKELNITQSKNSRYVADK